MIPDYQTLMLPVLAEASDQETNTRDVTERLADRYRLSDEERAELVPSGTTNIFNVRISWAKTYLKQAGLVRYTKRGYYIATDEGRRVLAQRPERIDNKFLEKYESFLEFRTRKTRPGRTEEQIDQIDEDGATPDEILQAAHKRINAALSTELLDRIRQSPPEFFEKTIIRLLLAMGYGGPSEDAGRALGKSGDDGVDGVIDQDPLGVDQVYVQAKRYAESNNVGPAAIRDFFGALSLKKAQKGIFVTTSSFSESARDTARNLGTRMVLIDGNRFAELLIRYNIGCRDEDVLYLKKIDEDFFE